MDYIVETSFEGPGFVAVPNVVAQHPGLGADALGVLVWLASLPKGFAIRRSTILERFGFGKDKWQRIAQELGEVGSLQINDRRGPDGRFMRSYRISWPKAPDAVPEIEASTGAENPPPLTGAENPPPYTGAENPPKFGGKPAKSGRKTRPSIKTKDIKKGGRDAAAGKGRSAASSAKGEARLGLDRVTVEGLSPFQRTQLLAGQSCLVSGKCVERGSPEMETLRGLLRGDCLERGFA